MKLPWLLSAATASVRGRKLPVVSADLCRCMPIDPCWPTRDIWTAFNHTLGGTLIKNSPIALPCHEATSASYNVTECNRIQASWFSPQTHINHASSVMAPYFTNNSCNPFSVTSDPCTMGNYATYSVNATSVHHFQRTIRFARDHNIRLVIRNTAHDYNGKSTGAGALALWVQYMKHRQVRSYNSSEYSGIAFKFGAGVQVQEAYSFADEHNMTVVGANQGTVGLVGGYTQGGGHGPLASRFGLAADQVLEWEVVLASGQIVTASRSAGSRYYNLYWALCGGGGGAFGAVVSVTVKAHPTTSLSTASLSFALSSNASKSSTDDYFTVIRAFIKQVPAINDAGAVAVWFITSRTFTLSSLFGPGLETHELDSLLQPVLDSLQTAGIPSTYASEKHATFLAGFKKQPSYEVANLNIGGRFVPRQLIDINTEALISTIRNVTEHGAIFSGVSFNVSMHSPASVSAHPKWRDAAFDAVVATPFDWTEWEKSKQGTSLITLSMLPSLERLTPGGGAYLNEADFQQPDWQETLYGDHYQQLNEVKARYDPKGMFYALGAVGSEIWVQKSGGRICRKI